MMGFAIRRLLIASAVVALASMLLATVANADHGEGHNGETLEISKAHGLEDGEVVTVTLSSWLPGHTATVVTCYIYPAAGPQDCELSNYGLHTVEIAEDGTGSLEYPVVMVPGRCDETTACLVVAGDGFGANANYAAAEFTFAAASAPEPEPTEAPEPEPEPAATEAPEPAPTEPPAPEPEPTEAPAPDPEPEPTEAAPAPEPEPAPTEAPMADDDMAATADDDDDGGSSVLVWLIPVIVVVVVAALVAFWMRRRENGRAAA